MLIQNIVLTSVRQQNQEKNTHTHTQPQKIYTFNKSSVEPRDILCRSQPSFSL